MHTKKCKNEKKKQKVQKRKKENIGREIKRKNIVERKEMYK